MEGPHQRKPSIERQPIKRCEQISTRRTETARPAELSLLGQFCEQQVGQF
jgi:hypothetical protein